MRTSRGALVHALMFATLALLPPAGAAQGLPRALPEAVGFDAGRLERLSGTLRGYVEDGRIPGAVALVARDGKVVYHEAFGLRDREADDPMRPDAIFRIASQTKALVSVAVMMLQERGQLLVGDPVGDYLPAFAHTTVAVRTEGGGYRVEDARRPVTIRDLLTHTAGVGYGSGIAADRWAAAGIQGWYFADRDEPIAATVERMAALPFDAHPGERFVYGYSTDILGVLVERVSGRPLNAFLRDEILEPLEMADTRFYLPPSRADRLASVYSLDGGALERAPDPGGMVGQGAYVRGPRTSFSGGAGLLSTAPDYARFLQMLLNGGELDGHRLLAPTTVALMTTDHLGPDVPYPDGLGFGLGFQVVDDAGARGLPGTEGEFGWGGAYHSTYWVDPVEGLVVVYLTQVVPAAGLDDFDKLRALVYQAMVESRASPR